MWAEKFKRYTHKIPGFDANSILGERHSARRMQGLKSASIIYKAARRVSLGKYFKQPHQTFILAFVCARWKSEITFQCEAEQLA